MAFNTNAGRAEFIAAAGQTQFDFNFKVYSDTDLVVYKTVSGQPLSEVPLTLVTDYTVSITGDNGGVITLTQPAGSNDAIVLLRRLPIVRDTEYQKNGDLLSTALNTDQNYQTYLSMDNADKIEKAFKLPESVQNTSATLPVPAPDLYLKWSADGTELENDSTLPTNVQIAIDSANEAKNALDEFNGIYLGSLSVEPAAADQGDLYFDTVENVMKVFNGTNWIATATSTVVTEEIIATDGQTIFTTDLTIYGQSALAVYINGVRQSLTQYVINDPNSITFSEPLNIGDEVVFVINEILSSGINIENVTGYFVNSINYLPKTVIKNGLNVEVNSYHGDGNGGGGTFYWDATGDKADHNGGTIIDPDIVYPADWSNTTQQTTWFTAGTGTGVWRRQYDGNIFVEFFGVLANQITSPTVIGIEKALEESAKTKNQVIFSDLYRLEKELYIPNNTSVYSTRTAEFQPAVVGINGVTIGSGNFNGLTIVPRIANYSGGFGLRLLGSRVADVYCHLVANCKDALVFECDISSTDTQKILDTKVTIPQIGNCERGVTYKVNSKDCVFQGNELYINFISGFSISGVQWETTDIGTHDWDSNKIQIQAMDSFPNTNVVWFDNKNIGISVDRWTIKGESWFGPIELDTVILKGSFNDLTFKVNLAGGIVSSDNMQHVGNRNRINIGDDIAGEDDTPVLLTNTGNTLSSFNGGIPLNAKRIKLKAVLPVDMAAGDTRTFYFYHMALDKRTLFNYSVGKEGSSNFIMTSIGDNSENVAKEGYLRLTNISQSTQTTGTEVVFFLDQVL